MLTFSTSEEPIVEKEQPNLGFPGFGFGSATVGHWIMLAFAGRLIATTTLYVAVASPTVSMPIAGY